MKSLQISKFKNNKNYVKLQSVIKFKIINKKKIIFDLSVC